MKNSWVIGLLMAMLVFSACSRKTTAVIDFEGGNLEVNEMDFDHFQGKTKITFKDPEHDINAKATIRIRKDSIIWMTFSAVGISGGKCLIDKDSITIINQLKREYYVYEYPELSKRFNFKINYETIQAAALGNLIIGRRENDRAIPVTDATVLRQQLGPVSVDNFIHKDTHKIIRVAMLEKQSENSAMINYNNFQAVNDQYFPFSGLISLFYKSENLNFNTTIEFEYSKAEISDKPLRFPFRIPKKYVRR